METAKSDIPTGGGARERIWIVDGESQRPFMRGILVHSLTARGLGFDEALEQTNKVHDRLRGRGTVPRKELAEIVREVAGAEFAPAGSAAESLLPTISVQEGTSSSPFSKGRLSQSLLAAAIGPNEAFEVAHTIELELRRQGLHAVRRADLRRRSYQALLQHFDSKTAERYLVWRKYQEPEKP
ncbi:MAG: ATP cone domain-containing protein, partial [Myxococcota bacterium]